MKVHIISIIFSLAWVSITANQYTPRVTKTLSLSGEVIQCWLHRFGDSDNLMLRYGKYLHISFDNGENWKAIDTIGEADIAYVTVDPFHQERTFVRTSSGKIRRAYVTEDQGRNWRGLSLTEDSEVKNMSSSAINMPCSIVTHPFNKNLLLLRCSKPDNNSRETIVVRRSDDGGESFRNIVASCNHRTTCKFAASSKESTLGKDGIYCIQTIENSKDTPMWSSYQNNVGLEETFFQQENQSIGILFYSDLGGTKKTFDELSELSVEQIFVLPSGVAVFTSEAYNSNNLFESPTRFWISTGRSFIPALLPEGVTSLQRPLQIRPDGTREQILWIASMENDGDSRESMRLLASDFSGRNFSFWGPTQRFHSMTPPPLEQVGNLKGTLCGKFRSYKDAEKTANWLSIERAAMMTIFENQLDAPFNTESSLQGFLSFLKENIFSQESHPNIARQQTVTVTKGSFDNGRTWDNLKVADTSGKRKHLFECDIDNTENCSFQEATYSHRIGESDPTAGIIMKKGTVGEDYIMSDRDDMTFISRDGGASWEVAFEFPVYAAFLDFGNIIVVLPEEPEKSEEDAYTKFLFSLDQGRTWKEHYFDEPIRHAYPMTFDGRGLKITIGFIRELEDSEMYVSYLVDFSNAFGRTACTGNDWETWYLSSGKCIDGMRYSLDRRRPDAKCLMRKTFEKLELHEERCES